MMKRVVSLSLILILLFTLICTIFVSCSSVSKQEASSENEISEDDLSGKNAANFDAIDVTMVQLLATPEKYDGELVRVIGVGNIEFEGDCLSLSKEDYQYHTGNQIWIELSDKATPYTMAQKYNGKYVIVEGYFDKDDLGHLGMFHGAIKEITRYELWEQ